MTSNAPTTFWIHDPSSLRLLPERGPDEWSDQVPDPLTPLEEPDEPSDLDDIDVPCTDDDSRWDAFIPDDDERDPLPDVGDVWIENS
jgi:hypothetical protein